VRKKKVCVFCPGWKIFKGGRYGSVSRPRNWEHVIVVIESPNRKGGGDGERGMLETNAEGTTIMRSLGKNQFVGYLMWEHKKRIRETSRDRLAR